MPPLVSIIIPVRNEEKYIGLCMERIFAQTYPKEKMEVLVVDGMSKDGTREIIKKSKIQNPKSKIQLLDNPRGHRANGLNIGIREAKGEVIVRIDARTVIGDDYVEKCVKTLQETGADNVGGVQVPLIRSDMSSMQKAIGLAATHPFGVGDAQFRLGRKSGPAESVYLGCFKKEIFDKIGLFDEDAPIITEDSDINYRIRKAGGKVYLNKDIVAYYIPRQNLRDLWRLYFRYGGARAGFFLKHRVLRWRQLVPVAFVSLLFIFFILSAANYIIKDILKDILKDIFYYRVNSIILFSPWILLGLYAAADICAAAAVAAHQKEGRLFLPLLAVFPCMHFAWAAGFIYRMLQHPKPEEYWGY